MKKIIPFTGMLLLGMLFFSCQKDSLQMEPTPAGNGTELGTRANYPVPNNIWYSYNHVNSVLTLNWEPGVHVPARFCGIYRISRSTNQNGPWMELKTVTPMIPYTSTNLQLLLGTSAFFRIQGVEVMIDLETDTTTEYVYEVGWIYCEGREPGVNPGGGGGNSGGGSGGGGWEIADPDPHLPIITD